MIQFENITKRYGDVTAVDDISLSIQPDELFGLIGADGAGKTTLMRILVSILLPDSGKVTMDGIDVVAGYKKIRQMVGYMPGRFSLYSDLTVEENLGFYASVFGTTIEENYYLIKDIYSHIEPFKTRRAGKLSGGMKQKLALSCALIHKPKVLVLDEPTTGVDAVSRKEFWEMLARLKQYGITIVVSTPYMDEAIRCDRVALMQEGHILAVDAPGNIIKNYGKKLLLVQSPNIYKLLTDLKNWKFTKSVYPFGQYLHLTLVTDDAENKLSAYLQSTGNSDARYKTGESNIEDVFMELMTVKQTGSTSISKV